MKKAVHFTYTAFSVFKIVSDINNKTAVRAKSGLILAYDIIAIFRPFMHL